MSNSLQIAEIEKVEKVEDDVYDTDYDTDYEEIKKTNFSVRDLYHKIRKLKYQLKNNGLTKTEYEKEHTIQANYIWSIYPIDIQDFGGEEQQKIRTKHFRKWESDLKKSFDSTFIKDKIQKLSFLMVEITYGDKLYRKELAALKRNDNYVVCSCGKEISNQHMKRHLTTKIHLKNDRRIEPFI